MTEATTKPAIMVFDFETTGLPHQGERIVPVQFASVIIDPNEAGMPEIRGVGLNEFLRIPEGATLGPYAMNMHRKKGRTHGFFQLNGRSPVSLYEQLYAELTEINTRFGGKTIPCGHNAGPFDVPLLLREAYLYGVDMGDVLDHHVIDTASMAFDRYGVLGDNSLPKVGLNKLAAHLGVTCDAHEQHDAMYDVRVTAACLRKMKGVV